MNKMAILDMLNNRINTVRDRIWGNPSYIDAYWRDLSNEFKGVSEDEVIEFLDSLEDEQLGYISEISDELLDIFEDSETFYDRYCELGNKHNVDLNV